MHDQANEVALGWMMPEVEELSQMAQFRLQLHI
jgi:hypothetical protein